MEIILNAFQSVLSIVVMIALGYYLTRRGLFDEGVSKLFSKLVINVSLPAMMVSNLLTSFDRENLYSAGKGMIIPFASMLICYAAAMAVARLIKVKPERKGIFQAMFFASNTISPASLRADSSRASADLSSLSISEITSFICLP